MDRWNFKNETSKQGNQTQGNQKPTNPRNQEIKASKVNYYRHKQLMNYDHLENIEMEVKARDKMEEIEDLLDDISLSIVSASAERFGIGYRNIRGYIEKLVSDRWDDWMITYATLKLEAYMLVDNEENGKDGSVRDNMRINEDEVVKMYREIKLCYGLTSAELFVMCPELVGSQYVNLLG